MIQITRLLARQFVNIAQRMLERRGTAGSTTVQLLGGPAGLTIRCQGYQHTLAFLDAEPVEAEQLTLPLELLQTVSGKKSDPVRLTLAADGKQVQAEWCEGPIPTSRSWDTPEREFTAPPEPEEFTPHGPELWKALRDAHEVTDAESSRYALGCLQLAGRTGSIAATDGSHLLVQKGFRFGFEQDLLVPSSKIFASPDLAGEIPVLLGRTATHLVLRRGPWTIYFLMPEEGRFPKVTSVIPAEKEIVTRVTLTPADAIFLRDNLPRLPSPESEGGAVTLDLNGKIAVRARATNETPPTELVLTGSRHAGPDLRIATKRNYLARALQLGLRELCFVNADAGLLARDETRSYVWMPLPPRETIPASLDAVVIASPSVEEASVPVPAGSKRTPRPQAAAPAAPVGVPAMSEKPARKRLSPRRARVAAQAELLEQSYRLRTHLREGLVQLRDLIGAIKRHRRQEQLVQTTLASLKQLQAA